MDKRRLKRLISHAFLSLKSNFFPHSSSAYRILMYHSISDRKDSYQMTTPLYLFEEQMKFLAQNHYRVISPKQLLLDLKTSCLSSNTILITFDDGFYDNKYILPIIEKYQFPVTIFLAMNYIKHEASYLKWPDIKSLFQTKLITFGSHTITHRNLKQLTTEDLKKEIELSKKTIENHIQEEVSFFAYPYGSFGSFDKRAFGILEQQGYKAAFTTMAGVNSLKTPLYQLRRTRISWQDDVEEFSQQLEGAYDWYYIWQAIQRSKSLNPTLNPNMMSF